jgi:hypothetical protein
MEGVIGLQIVKINSVIRIFLFLTLLLCFPNLIIAQCTDDDSDGYYYEAGCGTLRDCNDANSSINPGATEKCNGFDDDCDSSLDEGCDTICDNPEIWGSDVRVTEDEKDAEEQPALVWNGFGYGLSWHYDTSDLTEVYFARLDSSGNRIGSEIRVTGSGYSSWESVLAWTGIEYGIAYRDERESGTGISKVYFSRLDSSGNKIGSDKRVTDDNSISGWHSLAWTGKEFGVAFIDVRYIFQELYFARLDSSGNKIGSDVRISSSGIYLSGYPSLVWADNEFGVAWFDEYDGNQGIYFVRIDSSGNKIGSEVLISDGTNSSVHVSLVWTGNEYGLSWQDDRDGNYEIYFSRLDSSGNEIGSDIRVTWNSSNSQQPSLVWTGSEYGVSWHDDRDGNTEIYFARLDSSGSKIGSDLRVSYAGSMSFLPSLVWNGQEYAVAWVDFRDTKWEIYFNRVRCCDDVDMDTYTECGEDCDDNDETVYPGADELCDYKDNNCDGTIDEGFLAPGATTGLTFDKNKETMNWDSLFEEADRYDVMKGDLMVLRSSGGDFSSSLMGCIEEDSLDTQSSDSNDPGPGEGFYYIVRAQYDCKMGTCNTGQPGQVGDRDPEIESSSHNCL